MNFLNRAWFVLTESTSVLLGPIILLLTAIYAVISFCKTGNYLSLTPLVLCTIFFTFTAYSEKTSMHRAINDSVVCCLILVLGGMLMMVFGLLIGINPKPSIPKHLHDVAWYTFILGIYYINLFFKHLLV